MSGNDFYLLATELKKKYFFEHKQLEQSSPSVLEVEAFLREKIKEIEKSKEKKP